MYLSFISFPFQALLNLSVLVLVLINYVQSRDFASITTGEKSKFRTGFKTFSTLHTHTHIDTHINIHMYWLNEWIESSENILRSFCSVPLSVSHDDKIDLHLDFCFPGTSLKDNIRQHSAYVSIILADIPNEQIKCHLIIWLQLGFGSLYKILNWRSICFLHLAMSAPVAASSRNFLA